MPSWSDDEGRCHFMVGNVPCYQSSSGCPMHGGEKSPPKQSRVQVVPLEEVDLSKHGESLVRLFLEISTSDDLSERQKQVMLGALPKGLLKGG